MQDNPNYSYISTINTPDGTTHYIKDAEARTSLVDMTGATAGSAGQHGFVPAPAQGQQTYFLRGDGSWQPGTSEYTLPTASAIEKGGVKIGAGLVMTGEVLSVAVSAPMQFKGTLGTGGTITTLPTAGPSYDGFSYKVITAGTYAGQPADVGDMFICAKPEGASAYNWILIPSGDEPSGTVTNIATGTGLTGGPITSSGTIAIDTTYFGDLATKDSASGSYTPAGSVSTTIKPKGTVTVTPSTDTVYSITAVGSLPAFTATVANETLTLGWSAGTLPTKGSAQTVATGISSATFSGTQESVSGSFSGTPATITVS